MFIQVFSEFTSKTEESAFNNKVHMDERSRRLTSFTSHYILSTVFNTEEEKCLSQQNTNKVMRVSVLFLLPFQEKIFYSKDSPSPLILEVNRMDR